MATSLKSAMAPLNSISQSFTNNASNASYDVINTILSNDYWRAFLLTVTSVYAGYTLQPVPKKLNRIFNNSTSFKFIVLCIMLLTAFYPLNNNKIILAIVVPITVLVFFEILRKFDKKNVDEIVSDVKTSFPMSDLPIPNFPMSDLPIPSLTNLFDCKNK